MIKLFLKAIYLVAPFLLIGIVAIFNPYDRFYFRVEEALKVYKLYYPLTGPFYPSQKIAMDEEGDMGHGTPFAIKKTCYWETDRFGYRKADTNVIPEVVVIGDSNVYGNGLTQAEIFSEVLQNKIHASVYPYAPRDVNIFIHDHRFVSHPPKVIILEMIERNIMTDNERIQFDPGKAGIKSRIKIELNEWPAIEDMYIRQFAISLDRLFKTEQLNFLKAKLNKKTIGSRHHEMFFLEGVQAPVCAPEKSIRNIVNIINEYNEYFKSRHISFLFMPIPNKETIYFDLIPTRPNFTILKQVLKGCKQAGIPTIDLLSAFESSRKIGGNPYQIDDTHWNSLGVDIAAGKSADMINAHAPSVGR